MATFGFLYGVGESRLKEIKKRYLQNGMEPRIHKNTQRLPPKATSWEDNITLIYEIHGKLHQGQCHTIITWTNPRIQA